MKVDALFYLLVLSCLVSTGVGVLAWRRRHATHAAVALTAVMGFVARRAETIRQACADLVLRAVAAELLPDGSGSRVLPPITISIGISAMPDHGRDAESLLAAVDRALYAAKAVGRNRVVLAPWEPAPTVAAGPG